MANLTGHEAGNGGHSQGTPTAHRAPSYSEEEAVGCLFVSVQAAAFYRLVRINELVALKQRSFFAIETFYLETTLRELWFGFNAEKAVLRGIHRNLAMRKPPFAFGTVQNPAGHSTLPNDLTITATKAP
jgi:hypothetical protein